MLNYGKRSLSLEILLDEMFFLGGFAVLELLWLELRASISIIGWDKIKMFVIAVCYFLYETEDSDSRCR